MARRLSLSLALLAAASLASGTAYAESQPCANANSTVEMSLCIAKVLEQKDRELAIAMQKVAAEVSEMPGGQFHTLWKDNLTGFFKTSADHEDQLAAFQQARRNACVFINSIAFQSTGFGIFVSKCEIRMTDALMQSQN